jgi:hypothetical protein
MSEHVESRTVAGSQGGWNTLDELRTVAFSQGCTPAQFLYAIERAGDNPKAVASYLQQYAFMKAPDAATRAA